jgi:hypothetical protein
VPLSVEKLWHFPRIPGTPILLRGGREVGVGGELIDLVRTETETIARSRDPDQLRDAVYCWDDLKGIPLWIAQVRLESPIPSVRPRENAIENPAGGSIVVPSTIVDFVELAPFEYAVCWKPRAPDERNVACFNAGCESVWTIGYAPGQPPCAYRDMALKSNGQLEAYAARQPFGAVIDQSTGSVTATFPYR